MAQPAMVIDHTLRQFIYFWHCGLQPSLTLETLENGEIVASASVKSISAMTDFPLQPRDISRVKHCSGNNSRMKRRIKRRHACTNLSPTMKQSVIDAANSRLDSSTEAIEPPRQVQDTSFTELTHSFPKTANLASNKIPRSYSENVQHVPQDSQLEFGDGVAELLLALSSPCSSETEPSGNDVDLYNFDSESMKNDNQESPGICLTFENKPPEDLS